MHEMSLVRSLLTKVERLTIQNEATSVDLVTVEIGLLSGVEAELVQDAFEQLIAGTKFGDTQLEIHRIGLQIRCRKCQCEFAVNELVLQCSACGAAHVQVLRGDEFRLIDVTMHVPVISGGTEQ